MTPTQSRPDPNQPRNVPTLWGTVSLLAVLLAFLVFISYPAASILVATVGVASLLATKRVLPRVIARLRDETRRLTVPGVGTIEYRLTDR